MQERSIRLAGRMATRVGDAYYDPEPHAVPDGTYDSLDKARSMDRFSGSKRLEGDDK